MRRVVVTGLGLVTPLGGDVETSWANLIAGRSGAAVQQHAEAAQIAVVPIAARHLGAAGVQPAHVPHA